MLHRGVLKELDEDYGYWDGPFWSPLNDTPFNKRFPLEIPSVTHPPVVAETNKVVSIEGAALRRIFAPVEFIETRDDFFITVDRHLSPHIALLPEIKKDFLQEAKKIAHYMSKINVKGGVCINRPFKTALIKAFHEVAYDALQTQTKIGKRTRGRNIVYSLRSSNDEHIRIETAEMPQVPGTRIILPIDEIGNLYIPHPDGNIPLNFNAASGRIVGKALGRTLSRTYQQGMQTLETCGKCPPKSLLVESEARSDASQKIFDDAGKISSRQRDRRTGENYKPRNRRLVAQ